MLIHPSDQMYVKRAEWQYVMVGRKTVEFVDQVSTLLKIGIESVLDYGCGYGRLTREFVKNYNTYVTDVEAEGVRFCVECFGAREYNGEKVDACFVGSVLTHLDLDDWDRTMDALQSTGGVLMISTLGEVPAMEIRGGEHRKVAKDKSLKMLADYDNNGFGFAGYDETPKYGRTLVKPEWAFSYFQKRGLRVKLFHETGWGHYQDIYVLV